MVFANLIFRLFVENFFPINNNLKIKLGQSSLNLELKEFNSL